MLSRFDWLRLSRTGAELLATLRHFAVNPDLPPDGREIGPPHSGLSSPCERCWLYPPLPDGRYCPTCQAVLKRAWRLGDLSRHSSVIWGFVDRLPRQLRSDRSPQDKGWKDSRILGTYVHDEHRFLLMLHRKELKTWFQELAIYHGTDLRGLIQVFPTTGSPHFTMGEILCRVVHHESRFPMDRLRVRFFSRVSHVREPHRYDRQGILTFDVRDFLSLLEMASVFRTILPPDEQEMLHKILNTQDSQEAQLYWGRFLGYLDQEARDMLNSWGIRSWPKPQIRLLYDLTEYVAFYQTD